MNLLAQLSDRIIHFGEYNLMPLAFLTKLSIYYALNFMHQNGLSYLIIELEDSGQPVQGIQPKNNNNGKGQMFVILLASM